MMQAILSGFKNWQTTALGIAGCIHEIASHGDVFSSGSAVDKINVVLHAIGIMFLGIFAKDADKTGVLGQK